MQIEAKTIEGEKWIRWSDHVADLQRYKDKVSELSRRLNDRPTKESDNPFDSIFGKSGMFGK